MTKVMFVDARGNNETYDMVNVPRKGDTVPLFNRSHLKVSVVLWFPEKLLPELADNGIDVVITLEDS